jgi:hypothetical protein
MMTPTTALILGQALSVNWLWARTGGAIQSEPLYLLLGQSTILVAARAGRTPSVRACRGEGVALGVLLAACLLTRHVAVGLAMAVLLDLGLRRRWREVVTVAAIIVLLVLPWVAWMASADPGERTQADLVFRGKDTWPGRIAGQLVFYLRRIPDQITGPFVEVGTVFQRSKVVALGASIWAVAATSIIAVGWARALRRPRRRLAGLVALCTLLLLLVWPYTEAGRFLIPVIPCILVGAVEGLSEVSRRVDLGRRIGARRAPDEPRSYRRRRVAAGLVLAASLPYSAYALVTGKARETESSQRDFDAACAWLAARASRPGPVLTRHPGEVYWQTGRPALEVATSERPGDVDADADAIARAIDAYRVAYLLVDRDRYVSAPPSPLTRFVARYPGRAREVWSRESDRSAVVIYEVDPARL